MECQVRYGGIRRSSASPRPSCDGNTSASVWPSPRQTPGPPCTYSSDRTPPDATMMRVGAPSAWSSPIAPTLALPVVRHSKKSGLLVYSILLMEATSNKGSRSSETLSDPFCVPVVFKLFILVSYFSPRVRPASQYTFRQEKKNHFSITFNSPKAI